MRHLCAAAGGVPHLHARRCGMRDGATEVRIAGADVIGSARSAYAVADSRSSRSSSSGTIVDSGLVESEIGLRLPEDRTSWIELDSRDCAQSTEPTRPPSCISSRSL